LGLVAVHKDLSSRQQSILCKAAPKQNIRSAGLESPVFDLAVGLFHINVEPHMGIGPLHLRDRAFEFDGFIGVKFGCKRVVCCERRCSASQQQTEYDAHEGQFRSHWMNLLHSLYHSKKRSPVGTLPVISMITLSPSHPLTSCFLRTCP